MSISKDGVSRCGLCRFYTHEGRRGGICSQFNAPVSAKWDACGLAASPFESRRHQNSQKSAAIASTSHRWLVPETASELVANPTVGSSTVHADLTRADLARADLAKETQ